MAPEQSTQTDFYAPTPLTTPPNTQQQSYPAYQPQQQQQHPQFQPYQQYSQSYGQPFVPYQPPLQEVTPEKPQVPRNPAWEKIKLGLHIADIVFCVVGLCITFSLIGHNTAGYVALYACPVLIVPLLWSVAELITRCTRKNHHGIHPGAHVGVSLLIWMITSIVGGMECTFAAVGDYDEYDSSSDCYDRHTHRYDQCETAMDGKRIPFTVLAVMTCLVFLTHFILFVGACIDTAKRNAFNRARVMIVQQPYWGPMAQGWQPIAQGQEQPKGQNGQYMAVNQHDIQMQNRTPSPMITEPKGKEREVVPESSTQGVQGTQGTQETHQVREYYA